MAPEVSELISAVRAVSDDFAVGGASMRAVESLLRHCADDGFTTFFRGALELLEDGAGPRGGSVLHENGFRKISLFKDPVSSMQVRLNFWPAGTVDASIHNHRWHFLSWVVRGSLDHTTFDVRPSAEPGALSMVELSDADADLRKTAGVASPVVLRETHRTALAEGSAYALDLDSFHTIGTTTDAVTLMVTGRPLRPFTRVIRTAEAAATRRRLTDDECLEHVRRHGARAVPAS